MLLHVDVIKYELFSRYLPFVRGIHRSKRPVTRSCHVFVDLRLNNRLSKSGEAVDLRRQCVHYDVIVMSAPEVHNNIIDPFEICVKLKSHQISFAQFHSTDSSHRPYITQQYICRALYMISEGLVGWENSHGQTILQFKAHYRLIDHIITWPRPDMCYCGRCRLGEKRMEIADN